jgi:hypothetical protein
MNDKFLKKIGAAKTSNLPDQDDEDAMPITKSIPIKIFLLTLLLVPLFFSAGSGHVTALQGVSNSDGVDFFILIDQTNSMTINDPQNLRVLSAEYFLNYAAFYAHGHPESVNQISVIQFGASSNVSSLSPFPLTKILDQSPLLNELRSTIKPSNLGETDTASAFDYISRELDASSYAGDNRHRVILIITDGNPVSVSQSGLEIKASFSVVQAKYASLKEKHYGQWDLFVTGIYPQSAYWSDVVGPYWQSFSTSAVRIQQIQDIQSEIVRNISPTLGYGGRIYTAQEDVFVEPYQEEIRFLIQKYLPSDEISAEYDDGVGHVETMLPDSKDITRLSSANFELWTVNAPTAGNWRFSSSSNDKLDVIKQNIPVKIGLVFPKNVVSTNLPFLFQLSLLKYNASDLEKYPLTWDVSLVEPDENTIKLDVVDSKGESIFQSARAYVPTQVGKYKINIQISSQIGNAAAPILLSNSTYEFSAVEPEFHLAPPSPYLQYEPVNNLTLHLTDQDGNDLQMDPNVSLRYLLRLHSSSGQVSNFIFAKSDSAYAINQPILLPGNGQKVFEVVVVDDAQQELLVKKFNVETFTNIKLKVPQSQVAQHSSLTSVELTLLNVDNSEYILPKDSNLKLNVTIIPRSGESPVSGELKFNSATNRFAAQFSSLPTSNLGENIVRVSGVYILEEKEYTVFEQDLTYSVVANLPNFRVISPSSSSNGYPLYLGLKKVGLPIQIQWLNGDLPVDPGIVFANDPADLVKVDILKDGKPFLTNIKLSQLSENDPSTWGTTITDLNVAGNYVAVFKLQNAFLSTSKQSYDLEPSNIPFTLIQDALQWWLKFGGFIIITLIISFVAVREINERREPYPRGQLAIVEHNIDSSKNIAVVKLTGRNRRTVKVRLADQKLLKLGIAQLVIRHAAVRPSSQSDGIDVTGLNAKGEQVFSLKFDREQEKRIPRGDQPQVYYGLAYTPHQTSSPSGYKK